MCARREFGIRRQRSQRQVSPSHRSCTPRSSSYMGGLAGGTVLRTLLGPFLHPPPSKLLMTVVQGHSSRSQSTKHVSKFTSMTSSISTAALDKHFAQEACGRWGEEGRRSGLLHENFVLVLVLFLDSTDDDAAKTQLNSIPSLVSVARLLSVPSHHGPLPSIAAPNLPSFSSLPLTTSSSQSPPATHHTIQTSHSPPPLATPPSPAPLSAPWSPPSVRGRDAEESEGQRRAARFGCVGSGRALERSTRECTVGAPLGGRAKGKSRTCWARMTVLQGREGGGGIALE